MVLDKKSELYRIGSNFEQVWETMKMGVQYGHPIVWQYIIFGYNEHEIEQAKEIAHKEGITSVSYTHLTLPTKA